jgi:hypothetical protein
VFPQPGHEAAEGCEAHHEMLNIFNVPNLVHFSDVQNLVRVCYDVMLGDDVPQELAPGHSGGDFLPVQLNAEPSEVVEGLFQVKNQAAT